MALDSPVLVHRSRYLPTLAVAAAIVLWSASALFVRAGHADAMAFTTWRLWFALPPLALICALRSRRTEVMFRAPEVSPLKWVLVIAGAGAFFASGAATAFAAIDLTRLLDVTLIGALQPVVIIGFAVLFLGEITTGAVVARAAIAVGGTVLVAFSSTGGGDWSLAGELLAIASLFLNVGWYLYGRVLRGRYAIDPFAFMLAVLFAAAVIMTPLAALTSGLALPLEAIGWSAATMVVGTSAHVLVVWAHRFMPASHSAPWLLAEPPLVAVAAWIFFGEALGPLEILGSAIVVFALWGMVRAPELEHVEEETSDPAPPA